MKKGNIIQFTKPDAQEEITPSEPFISMSEELKTAIQELIHRMRLGEQQSS